MTEKPVLFSGPMVRAILAGQKTQTRRVVSRSTSHADAWPRLDFARAWVDPGLSGRDAYLKAPLLDAPGDPADERIERVRCRYVPLDRLWVRETWRPLSASYEGECVRVRWAADGGEATRVTPFSTAERMLRVIAKYPGQWRPSIYCERWASRLLLRVESIRVERLQDITEEDARAEGVAAATLPGYAAGAFRALWDSINGKRPGCSWDENPWVWVVTFSRVTP